jgi:hypothetical protein
MMPVVELAKRWNAVVSFWAFWRLGVEETDKNYKQLAIFEESHPQYNRFVKILGHEAFKSKNIIMSPGLMNLQPVSAGRRLNNMAKTLFKIAGKG